MNNRVLLTGADGQVGQEIINQVKGFDFAIDAFGKRDLDITSRDSLLEKINQVKPSIIINAAAYTSVDNAESNKEICEKVNVEGPRLISEICKKNKILLIHLSTDYVFNGEKTSEYDEKDLEDPVNHYGKTKLEGEASIKSLLSEFFIIRTSWVFGVSGKNFPKTILGLCKNNQKLNIINDVIGSPTSARSIARFVLKICSKFFHKEPLQFGTYHFTNVPATTWYEFSLKVLEISNKIGLISAIPEVKAISSSDYPSNSLKPKNSSLSNKEVISQFKVDLDKWEDELVYTLKNIEGIS